MTFVDGLTHPCILRCRAAGNRPVEIEAVYPQTQVQLCMVHLLRNSLKYVPWKQQREVAADLKSIYQASTLEQAEDALTAFSHKWDERYPTISGLWLSHWQRIIPFFAYPADIRRLVYTTNAIESVNCSLRKVLKTKGSFPIAWIIANFS